MTPTLNNGPAESEFPDLIKASETDDSWGGFKFHFFFFVVVDNFVRRAVRASGKIDSEFQRRVLNRGSNPRPTSPRPGFSLRECMS